MNKITHYVSSGCLNHYASLVEQHNGDLDYLLITANISAQLLDSDERLIPLDNYVYLLELSAKTLNTPYFAMELALKQEINFLGPLSIMLYKSIYVADAIDTIRKYFKLTASGVDLDISLVADTVSFQFRCDLPYVSSSIQYQDYVLGSTVKVIWKLVGRKYPFRGCYFTCPNQEGKHRLDFYTTVFGCPIAFDSRVLTLTADSQLLSEPLLNLDTMLSANMAPISGFNTSISQQVSQLIRFLMSSGLADINTVAKKLGYSRRTLQRRLKEESTSFIDILDEVRSEQAAHYLLDTSYRLTEISLLLGYKNLGSFTRSFRRWFGYEPSKARFTMSQT
jgi:AraC-like DNA-binding protein